MFFPLLLQCTSTASLNAFMEHFRSETEPTYISLFCCGCSGSTISVAEISHYWNIPHVSVCVCVHFMRAKSLSPVLLCNRIPQKRKQLNQVGV